MESARLPRFARSNHIEPMRLTERDREIIKHIHRYRFLRSDHLTALLPGSRQQLLRRLQRLFHHGYLDRPRAQIDYYRRGSQAMVYGIGHAGVKLLEEDFEIPRRKLDWTAKNRSATRFFLEHTLAVADVMVALEVACRADGSCELCHPSPENGQPQKWHVQMPGFGPPVGVVPDRVFGIRARNHGAQFRWFFLEADRATMPVERPGSKQTSFGHKLRAYYHTWRQGVVANAFPRFRVLTVTTTPERAAHLIQTHQTVNGNKAGGLFLFTNRASVLGSTDPLQQPLLDGRGTPASLMQSL